MAKRGKVKSASQAWSANNHLDFTNLKIPDKSDNGKRTVIDGFKVVMNMSDVTVAGIAIQGEDRARFIKRLRITEKGVGERWNLTGEESRWAAYMLEGPHRVAEYGDSAVAANQNLLTHLYIPMTKRYNVDGEDFALPAELLENIRIETASATDLGASGGTVTINTGSYYIIAYVHEEDDVVIHVADELRSTPFKSATALELKLAGWCPDLGFFKPGASGGASLTSFTSVRTNNGGPIPTALLREPDLVGEWERDHDNVSNGLTQGAYIRTDPFTQERGVPVFWSSPKVSNFEYPLIDELEFVLDNSVTDMVAVHRTILPRNDRSMKAQLRRHKKSPAQLRVKTKGKTMRQFSQWARVSGGAAKLSALPLKVAR